MNKIINIRIPLNLLKASDEAVKKYGYESRTAFILDAMRNKLAELCKQEAK